MLVEQPGTAGHRRWKPRKLKHFISLLILPSTTGHVEPCRNPVRPFTKTKYKQVTDRELVPWGKGEKYSEQESEIVPEIICIQAVEALCP